MVLDLPDLTVAQVAELLGVHVKTVRQWSNEGVLPYYQLPGRRNMRRYRRADVLALMQPSGTAAPVDVTP
jgi:excisionase family DNA binding protein